jgi:hypothetical protein
VGALIEERGLPKEKPSVAAGFNSRSRFRGYKKPDDEALDPSELDNGMLEGHIEQ